MKVCILGPITSNSHFGGVATFNEGLYSGFLDNDFEVLVVTNTKNGNIESEYYSKSNFFINKKKVTKKIKSFAPDIIVSSMWYGVLNKNIKKALPNAKIIHILHGFPTYRYSKRKRYTLNKMLKKIRKHTNFFISNSAFTGCINTEIYGIKSDKTVHLGIREKFIDFNKPTSSNQIKFLFAGRIVESKNVDIICEIFNALSKKIENISLDIVGDGDKRYFYESKYKSDKINFLGKKTREETLKYFENAHVFISLNPHEPFGLVYLEALLKKCKIVCPNTGGQTEFLNEFKEVAMIDLNDIEKTTKQIIDLLEVDSFKDVDLEKFFNYFSYSRVAKELIDIN